MTSALGLAGAFIGIALLGVIAGIAYYVVMGLGGQKMLKALNYDKPWMAWIPFGNYWAFVQVASGGQSEMKIFNFQVPTVVMGFWWILQLLLGRISYVGTLLSIACQTICLGVCFTNIYAMLDGKSKEEETAFAYVSGFFPLIAFIKFLGYQGPQMDYHN